MAPRTVGDQLTNRPADENPLESPLPAAHSPPGRWLLDTNVVSELMRPVANVHVLAWLAKQPVQALRLSSVTAAELWAGVFVLPKGARRSQLLTSLSLLLAAQFRSRIVPFDEVTAIACASVLAERRRQGRPVGWPDAQIAGTARHHGLGLVTRNTRDFEGCGVALINPWLADT